MSVKQTAGRDALGRFAPEFARLNDDVLFGEVWSREDELPLKLRSIATVSALIGKGIVDGSLKYHLGEARKNGVTQAEMAELLTHLAFYAGWPNAWAAFGMAKDVYADGEADRADDTGAAGAGRAVGGAAGAGGPGMLAGDIAGAGADGAPGGPEPHGGPESPDSPESSDSPEPQGGPFGLGEPNDAFARYFIGQSYLKCVSAPGDYLPIFNVTFEPGCRNNWHIHHASAGGGQVLVCVEGRGWYQEEGKPARALKPGDVVEVPANVKHWHGAAADSWLSHLAFECPGQDCSNEWCEPVDDDTYNALEA